MPELKLVLTEKFTAQANDIRSALSCHLEVGQPDIHVMRSVDPPSFIQLLGDAVAWSPLKVAATVYLLTLVKRTADWTWDKLVNKKEVKPLIDVVTILVDAKTHINGEVHIDVGLNIPDDAFGTTLSITSSDPEKIVYEFATFLVHVEPLSHAMQEELAAGREPFGPVLITIQEDGGLRVRWRLREDNSLYEIRVTRPLL